MNQFEEDDDLTEPGCLFPGECLMPGFHLKAECHTVEMIEAYLDAEGHLKRDPGQ